MDFSWRRRIYHNNSYYYGHFQPYRRPYSQQFYQLPVAIVQIPIPTQPLPRDYHRTFDKDIRKHFGKSKSSATKARDKRRKHKFIENKTVCCGFPFSGLDDDSFQKEFGTQMDSLETKSESKLKRAAETIKELQTESKRLRSTNETLQRMQTRQTDIADIVGSEIRDNEMSKLRDDLGFEKERVIKLVTQNVERQREINYLRNEQSKRADLVQTSIEKCNSIMDEYHRQTEQVAFLQKDNQLKQRIIDYLAQTDQWKKT